MVLLLPLTAAASCSGSSWVGVKPFPNPAPSSILNVFVWSGDTSHPVVNAVVLASTQTGLKEIGRTNGDGQFNIAKKFVSEQGIQALLFCQGKAPFPCGAVRLDDPATLGFDEINVQIPLYTTIDRVRIN